jgi:hypothetical protein
MIVVSSVYSGALQMKNLLAVNFGMRRVLLVRQLITPTSSAW